jgi:putative metallohydrolase (TIGR04338 family)
VYAAERSIEAWTNQGDMTLDEIRAWLTKIFASAWFKKHYPKAKVWELKDGRGRRMAGGHGTRIHNECSLTLPRWARSRAVVLHELAHGLVDLHAPVDHAAHGWEFCEIFLDLVRHFLGRQAYEDLRSAFKEHRVRYTAPRKRRPLTEAQKAALRERLKKARAAKQAKEELEKMESAMQLGKWFRERWAAASHKETSMPFVKLDTGMEEE